MASGGPDYNLEIPPGGLILTGSGVSALFLSASVAGDSGPRFEMNYAGGMLWFDGAGNQYGFLYADTFTCPTFKAITGRPLALQVSGALLLQHSLDPEVPLTVQLGSGQTADLVDLKNHSGSVIAKFDASGNITWPGTLTSTSGITLAAGGADQDIDLTPSGTGAVNISTASQAPLTINASPASPVVNNIILKQAGASKWAAGMGATQTDGSFEFYSYVAAASALVMSPTAGTTIAALGTNKNITLTPSGSGIVTTSAPCTFGNITWPGSLTSSGAITLAGGGSNQNINLTPSGTGQVAITSGGTAPLVLNCTPSSPLANNIIVQQAGTSKWAAGMGATQTDGSFEFYSYVAAASALVMSPTAGTVLTALGTNKSITLTPGSSGFVALNGNVTMPNNKSLYIFDDGGVARSTLILDNAGPTLNVLHIRNNQNAVGGTISIEPKAGAGVAMTLLASGFVGIGTATPHSALAVKTLPVYANNAAAITGGLAAGDFYRTGANPDPVCVVH